MYSVLRRAGLTGASAWAAYCVVGILLVSLIALILARKLGVPLRHANLVAAATFLLSLAGLACFRDALLRSPCFASAPQPLVPEAGSRAIVWAGAAMATAWVLVTLPATYRATGSVREVMVFWHDEGITLDLIYRFVTTPGAIPDYRLTQGWITFLPVALLAKAINLFVPVEVGTINLLMRHYYLAVCWGIIYSAMILMHLLTRSLTISALIVLLAFWREEMYLLLAIDRPDGFQLLFMLLSLIGLIVFLRRSSPRALFRSIMFAGLAFASKYSGHLLLPAVGCAWLWHVWQSRPALTHTPGRIRELCASVWLFMVSATVIVTLAFFLASPFHLINFWPFVRQIAHFLPIYGTGNIYNLPNYNPPPNAVLWWSVLSGRSAFDYWMLISCGLGMLVCAALTVKDWTARRLRPETFMLIWVLTYASFMVSRYGGELVGYRYVFPVLLFVPYYALFPLWLATERLRDRALTRGAVLIALCAIVAAPVWIQISRGFNYLAHFRVTEGPSFEVGRFLDRYAARDVSPSVLMTNLAYIPDRFTKLTIANVSVTLDLIDTQKYDYVIMSANMYDVYAGNTVTSDNNPYYAAYAVYYNDVVAAYTAFKHRTHPDYRLLRTIDGWEVFERIR